MSKLLDLLEKLTDRFCVVVGVFLGSQIPAFMQQYTQHLAGRAEELNRLILKLESSAALSKKTLAEYLHKFLTNPDQDFVAQGQFMESLVSRASTLNDALNALQEGSLLARPYLFLRHFQSDIAESTWKNFHPSLDLSLEGCCYALLGAFIGYLLCHGSFFLFSKLKPIKAD